MSDVDTPLSETLARNLIFLQYMQTSASYVAKEAPTPHDIKRAIWYAKQAEKILLRRNEKEKAPRFPSIPLFRAVSKIQKVCLFEDQEKVLKACKQFIRSIEDLTY
jgi:hypothetical protein